MNISNKTMEWLAALSKLELAPVESEQLSGELESIINYMDILAQLPAESADLADCPSPLHSVLRPDTVIPSHDRADLLVNAPETDGKSLTVPKTVG